jgi:alpha-tubulin suppressor-like RCC1 family protein
MHISVETGSRNSIVALRYSFRSRVCVLYAAGELSTGDEIDCFLPTEIRLPPNREKRNSAINSSPATPFTPNALPSSLGTSNFAQVCLGLHHMVVLTWDNEVCTCGSWVANLLGTEDRANLHRLKRLKQFEALRAAHPENPIISIGCGDRHTVALHQNGDCESFGGTIGGKLGHAGSGTAPQSGDESGSPQDSAAGGANYSSITGLHGERVTQMDAGNLHTVCCTVDGAVFSFGGGGKFFNQGQLGHGDCEDRMLPRRIERFGVLPASKVFVVSISCGGYHTLVLTRDRLVYSMGSGKYGQLGHGTDNNETTPQLITGLIQRGSGVGQTVGLAAGENHSLCVQSDGSVYSWGFGLQVCVRLPDMCCGWRTLAVFLI